jgi:hypothetical protein
MIQVNSAVVLLPLVIEASENRDSFDKMRIIHFASRKIRDKLYGGYATLRDIWL